MTYYSKIIEHPENYSDYLRYISDLDISTKEKYELLYIVNSIMSYFVDQAFNVQTDQVTLQSLGKINSKTPFGSDAIGDDPESQTAQARTESNSNPLGPSEP